ncbi:MAG: hypothetical protein HRU20_08220 [Pseudomonadales bacterium]|nr:hypothetical protein [Pseudomonadales bacterium]
MPELNRLPCILTFFKNIIAEDAMCLAAVDQAGADMFMQEGSLIFSIAALHQLLIDTSVMSYGQFRKALYASTLNADLLHYGYSISVFSSAGHVDQSYYQLVKIK